MENSGTNKYYFFDVKNTLKLFEYDEKIKLTDFEKYKIAIEIQRNRIIADAFGVTFSDATPKFLEMISIIFEKIEFNS